MHTYNSNKWITTAYITGMFTGTDGKIYNYKEIGADRNNFRKRIQNWQKASKRNQKAISLKHYQ